MTPDQDIEMLTLLRKLVDAVDKNNEMIEKLVNTKPTFEQQTVDNLDGIMKNGERAANNLGNIMSNGNLAGPTYAGTWNIQQSINTMEFKLHNDMQAILTRLNQTR